MMFKQPDFEIPAAVREIAERNVAQVRQAHEQFMGLVTKSQEAMLKSQNVLTMSAVELQNKAMQYTQENIAANFRFASDVAKARDFNEFLEVQSHYAQSQIETYARQTQEITRLLSGAAHKVRSKP